MLRNVFYGMILMAIIRVIVPFSTTNELCGCNLRLVRTLNKSQ